MTQDVQPLTWQKRTNLEEHQQFFSKINEIIDNLAPTVDEAEAAIAQATAAIASANDAIATANAASAAASAAATQAQTAASTVAGYDARLTAVEGEADTNADDIAVLQGRMGTAEGNITSLGTRMTAAESKNNQQDTAISALQTADRQNVKIDRINEYAVGLTSNQDNILGNKNFKGLITLTMSRIGYTGGSGYNILYRFKNNHTQTLLITGGRTIIIAQVSAGGGYKGQVFTSGRDYKTPSWLWVVTDATTGDHYLVSRGMYSATMNVHVINSFQYGSVYPYQDDIEAVNQSTDDPTTDTRWSNVMEVVNYD